MGEPTHGEILRAIGVLEGQLKQLLDAVDQDGRERSSIGDRVSKLEQRMAQVVIIAVIAASVSARWPEIREMFRDRAIPEQVQQNP